MGLTERELERAYILWRKHYEFVDADQAVLPFLGIGALGSGEIGLQNRSKESEGGEWLRRARTAQILTVEAVAEKMGVAKNVYWKMEQAEETGAVTLESMRRAAAAMDCELIYVIRPRKRQVFSKVIWQKLYFASKNHWWVQSRPRHLKANALAAICRQNFADLRFRKQQGWSLRRGQAEK